MHLCINGSPDNCGKICDEYAKKDSRIIVIHKENGGLSSARNAGLNIATGDYIAFVDSDDWIDENMYESLLTLAKKYSADIAEGNYRFFRPWKTENKVLDCENSGKVQVFDNAEALNTLYFGDQRFNGLTIMVVTKLYRKELLKDLRFPEPYKYEDIYFTPMVYYKAHRIAKIDFSYYTYNIHLGEHSVSGEGVNLFGIQSKMETQKLLVDFFDGKDVPVICEKVKELYVENLLHSYFLCYKNRRKEGYKNEMILIIDQFKNIKYKNRSWRCKLFKFSPTLFCIFKKIKEKKDTFYNGKKKK